MAASLRFVVGESVWWEDDERRRGHGRLVQVEKIGRRWVTLDNGYRVDVKTGYADAGRVYQTERACLEVNALKAAWREVRQIITQTYARPEHLTLEDIGLIKRLVTGEQTGGC